MLRRICKIRALNVNGTIQKRFASGWPADGSTIENPANWPTEPIQPEYQEYPRQSSGSIMWLVYLSGLIAAWTAGQIYHMRPVDRTESQTVLQSAQDDAKKLADEALSMKMIYPKKPHEDGCTGGLTRWDNGEWRDDFSTRHL